MIKDTHRGGLRAAEAADELDHLHHDNNERRRQRGRAKRENRTLSGRYVGAKLSDQRTTPIERPDVPLH